MPVALSAVLLTTVATGASAAPETNVTSTPIVGEVAATNEAKQALRLSQTVTVSADATWSVDTVEADSTPAPVIVIPVETAEQETEPVTQTQTTTTETAEAITYTGDVGDLIATAYQYIGTPYVYGGSTPSGFDCSGFTQYVFREALGIDIGRTSDQQYYAGTVVSEDQAQAGDLVWWPGHVGIYLGNGQHIAARQPGTPLYVSAIYKSNPTYIRVIS